MKCHPCVITRQNDPFSAGSGCTNFRNSTLVRHQKTSAHTDALKGLKLQSDMKEISMWPSQIENDPQSQLPGGHNDPWKFFWRENPDIPRRKYILRNYDQLTLSASGPSLVPHLWRGKFRCPNTLSLVSFAGMALDKCAVLRIDSLLYRRIQNNADRCQLQEDLDKLKEWEQKWQMALNAEKCEVIRITNKKRPLCSDYFIHNQKLALRTEAKYLGVTIGSDLSWSRHADNITKKANSTMGFLKKNIRSAPQAAKETAYKTFVRPIVEYAATTWAPFTDTETSKIEMVQRRAARFVSNEYRRTSSVTEMISTLGWEALQKRRILPGSSWCTLLYTT